MNSRNCSREKTKRQGWFVVLPVLLLVVLFALPVSADTGPKPSLQVSFENVPQGLDYYVTALSETPSTGPSSAYAPSLGYTYSCREDYSENLRDVFDKFSAYEDADGFWFLQDMQHISGEGSYRWGYYPPSVFKILVYFPQTDTFAVSGIYERYAFDSYFVVDGSGFSGDVSSQSLALNVVKNYSFPQEIGAFFIRLLFTIFVEILLACLFGYTAKKQLLFLLGANILTQLLLNVGLSLSIYFHGGMNMGDHALILLAECAIVAVEAIAYLCYLPRHGKAEASSKGRAVVYAMVANVASYILGLLLSVFLPAAF